MVRYAIQRIPFHEAEHLQPLVGIPTLTWVGEDGEWQLWPTPQDGVTVERVHGIPTFAVVVA